MFNTKTLATLAAAGVLGAALAGCTGAVQSTSRSSSSDVPAAGWSDSTSAAAPQAPAARLTPADFMIGVVVTEKKCFGSAGCSLEYTIDPQYIGTAPLPAKTTVVYSVTGGDQAQVGNFSIVADGTATFDAVTSIDAQEGAVLTATVTQVVPGR